MNGEWFPNTNIGTGLGLNIHIYHGSGNVIVDLEKNPQAMKAMQSLLISSHQVLKCMELITDTEYYESKIVRAYLKTKKGVYFKELYGNCKEDEFLLMLMNYVLQEIAKSKK